MYTRLAVSYEDKKPLAAAVVSIIAAIVYLAMFLLLLIYRYSDINLAVAGSLYVKFFINMVAFAAMAALLLAVAKRESRALAIPFFVIAASSFLFNAASWLSGLAANYNSYEFSFRFWYSFPTLALNISRSAVVCASVLIGLTLLGYNSSKQSCYIISGVTILLWAVALCVSLINWTPSTLVMLLPDLVISGIYFLVVNTLQLRRTPPQWLEKRRASQGAGDRI